MTNWPMCFIHTSVSVHNSKSHLFTSGLERQIGPFSGLFLDIGPDRNQVPKSGLEGKHCSVQFLLLVQGRERRGGRRTPTISSDSQVSEMVQWTLSQKPKAVLPCSISKIWPSIFVQSVLGVFLTGRHKYLCKTPIEGLAPFLLEIPPARRCSGVPHSWFCSMCSKPGKIFSCNFFSSSFLSKKI